MVRDYATLAISRACLDELRQIVQRHFVDDYSTMYRVKYHEIVAAAQNEMNAARLPERIAGSISEALEHMLRTHVVLVQSNLYLRAARPVIDHEVVGWHRESFYGAPASAFNVWVPVLNCTPENSLQYIPGSASIPDDQIVISIGTEGAVEKGSAGHKIGMLYAPSAIIAGVDLSTAQRMLVPGGFAAAFSGQLVHGAGSNHTDKTRFSVDMRVLASEDADKAKKGRHFASGRDYFVPLES